MMMFRGKISKSYWHLSDVERLSGMFSDPSQYPENCCHNRTIRLGGRYTTQTRPTFYTCASINRDNLLANHRDSMCSTVLMQMHHMPTSLTNLHDQYPVPNVQQPLYPTEGIETRKRICGITINQLLPEVKNKPNTSTRYAKVCELKTSTSTLW